MPCNGMTDGDAEGPESGNRTALPPDEAFTVLGNGTRIAILQELGTTETPLSFTELRNRVGVRQGSKFNYHLDKLVGHFVRKTEEGYDLKQTGRRVVMAVLSGAVTDDPELDPTPTDISCWYCGGVVEVGFREERATAYCTECGGTYGESIEPPRRSRLGYMYLPPAGILNRTAGDIYRTALTWGNFELLARAVGICLYCAAPLDEWVTVCEEHDDSDGLCRTCDRRYAALHHTRCTNCIFSAEAVFFVRLLANPDLREFLLDHDIDPIDPSPTRFFQATSIYDEEIRSVDPFKASFSFTIDGDSLTLVVDEDFQVEMVMR